MLRKLGEVGTLLPRPTGSVHGAPPGMGEALKGCVEFISSEPFLHGLARSYTGLHGLTQSYTVLDGLAQSCTVLHGLAWSYTVLHGHKTPS